MSAASTLTSAEHRPESIENRNGTEPFVVFGSSKSGTTWVQRILDLHPQIRCHFQRPIFPCVSRSHLLAPVTVVYDRAQSPFGGVFEDNDDEARYQAEHAYLEQLDLLLPGYPDRIVPERGSLSRPHLEAFHARAVRGLVQTVLEDDPAKQIFGTKAFTELDELFRYFPEAKVIHIVRDGRDVVVSKRFHTNRRGAYYHGDEGSRLLHWVNRYRLGNRITRYLQRHHGRLGECWFTAPEAREHLFTPHILEKLTLDWHNVVRYLLDFERRYPEQFLLVRYESLLTSPAEAIAEMLRFLEARDDDDIVASLVEQTSFSASKRKGSFFRKGQRGDWANHFTAADVDLFKRLAGDLLVELGYEQDTDWGPAETRD